MRRVLVLVALLLPFALTGCAARSFELSAGSPRVLVISVDGLNPRALTRLGPQGAPTLHRLMAEGASTLNARTLYEETVTLPNHTSMLTGLRARLPRGHGVRVNDDPGTTLRRTAGRYVPGVFDIVHDRGGRTALYTAKEKFRFLNRSWNGVHGARDRVGADHGRDKIDRFVLRPYDDARLVHLLSQDLLTRPRRLSFLHLAAPDTAGHMYGGMSPEYLEAVRRTDALLGDLLSSIETSPTLAARMLIVVTSDHGTNGLGHDDVRRIANYRVPFIAWGNGVAAGADLYALNPGRRDPGRTRPTYDGVQPIRNGDVANLVANVLGLPPVRGSEFGFLRTLDLR